MNQATNTGGLDRFRLAGALLVAAIHTSPLTCISAEADFFLTRILARVAVPFFLMVTGQFVLPRILESGVRAGRRLLRYLVRTGMLYLACILLYLPLGIYAGHYKELTAAKVLRMLVWDGTFYHLWYFPAGMLGMTLLYLLSRRLKLRSMTLVCGALYLLGLSGDSYYGLTQYLPPLRSLCDLGFHVWSYTRNGLFLAPLFLLMGALMGGLQQKNPCANENTDSGQYAQNQFSALPSQAGAWKPTLSLKSIPALTGAPTPKSASALTGTPAPKSAPALTGAPTPKSAPALTGTPAPKSAPALTGAPTAKSAPALTGTPTAKSVPALTAGLVLSLLGMSGEAFLLRYLESLRHDSMYLLLVPLMYCLYGLLLCANCPPCPRLRRLSTLIYILHPAVIVAVRICARLPHMLPLMEQSLLHYLAVCLLSLAAAWLLTGLWDRKIKRNDYDK